MRKNSSFWSGMTVEMKGRFLGLMLLLFTSIWLFLFSPILGTAMLLLPVLWGALRTWFSASPSGKSKSDSALGYSLDRLWRASGLVQLVFGLIVAALFLSGLTWISTENMRAKAVEPTLTERASEVAETAKQTTKETASSWFSTAKGWFSSDLEE